MSSYTNNIPQPGDDPSDSQNQILENFQTLNSLYGTAGDHYPWTNQTAVEGSRHAKVTLPGLPTSNAPGNAIPTPAANELVMFGITAGTETRPFYRRDTGTLNIPLAPIIAFGRATGSTIVGNAFNIDTIVQSPTGTWTFTLSNTEPDSNYMVLALPFNRTSGGPGTFCASISDSNFVITVADAVVEGIMAIALRYTL